MGVQAQSVGLVLSGGGAKGLSHIGVIKALEENNIPIDYISGTSMGAIVGGLYAIGLSPEDMIYIIKSERFLSWYKGQQERDFSTFIYQMDPTPDMIRFNIRNSYDKNGDKKGLKISLPTSIVSPYPMDLAVVQLFGTSSAACQGDFNNLMVPFFSVAADIAKKREYVCSSGDLGSAIRASMTFPAYFKPIVIDSTLLFDGGFYNNFPWKEMEEIHNPDYIIGSKCVKGEEMSLEEDDPFGMLEMMISVDSDYDIPIERGLVIGGEYNYGLMDFHLVDEIVNIGYENTLKSIPELKNRIKRERTPNEVDSMRLAFRSKCPPLVFKGVNITGSLDSLEKEYIKKTVSGEDSTFSFSHAKRGYYKVAASNSVNTFYPTAIYDPADSLFTLNLDVSKRKGVTILAGGNISSLSLIQGYMGFMYQDMDVHPYRAILNLNIGQLYIGSDVSVRKDLTFNPLSFVELDVVAHRWDYLTSNQSPIFSTTLSRNVVEKEVYSTINFGIPLSERRGIMLFAGSSLGSNEYDYFPSNSYSKYDIKDKTKLRYITPRIMLEQNTLNFKQYPTEGKSQSLDLRYLFGIEKYTLGTLSSESVPPTDYQPIKHHFSITYEADNYYSINKWLSFGLNAKMVISNSTKMRDYLSTILVTPSYTPTIHSKTLLLEGYRAPIFAAATITPIFKISSTISIRTAFGYFQPYQNIVEKGKGQYDFSEPLPMGNFLGDAAVVWQSPVGPVSISCAYYQKADTKFYPQLNIGFIIFKSKGLYN